MLDFRKLIYRFVELTTSLVLLFVLIIPIVLLVICSTVSTRKFGLFLQERIGQNKVPFKIFKIRTMIENNGSSITTSNDPRVTRFGRFCRRYKLDELPQLINILNGTMSFVGPRPDVAGTYDSLSFKEARFLRLKPGVTGLATLIFKNEEAMFEGIEDIVAFNKNYILRRKIKLNNYYYDNKGFILDIKIIIRTLGGKFGCGI